MSLERFTRKEVVTAEPRESAASVADKMRTHHVGAVVIVQERRPIGIVTDRDLALRVVATRVEATLPIELVMSRKLVTARVTDLVDQVAVRMRQEGVRRMPILTPDGNLAGLVSLDDLHVLLSGELSAVAQAIVENRGP